MTASSPSPLVIYLSLTSSPSTPRAQLILHPPSSSDINDSSNNNVAVTASELRRRASEITSVPLESIKLIFRGRVIPEKDVGDVVQEYKLEDGCVVHVMGKPSVAANDVAGTATATASAPRQHSGATVTLPPTNSANAARIINDSASLLSSSADGMIKAAISKLRSSNDSGTYREALSTAHKLLGNIINNPSEAKYRSIKKSNPAFLRRLGSLPGGSDLLFTAGFVVEIKDDNDEGRMEYYVLTPSADAWPRLVAARDEIGQVLSGIEAGVVHQSSTNVGVGAAATSTGSGQNANAFQPPLSGGMMPDSSAIQSMLRDPNMLRNVMEMMNDPRVQTMMNNDPRFANNPMLQQSLGALQSNPEMVQQISRMMGDPNNGIDRMMAGMNTSNGTGSTGVDPFAGGPESMRRLMEQFQQRSEQFGGSSGGVGLAEGGHGGGTPGGTSVNSALGGNGNASTIERSSNDDNELTEEEMIAEAIARSLRES